MSILRNAVAGALFVALSSSVSFSADVSALEIGDFTPHTDGLFTTASAVTSLGKSETNLAMKIDAFEVKAEGDVNESTSSFSGHFEVSQPARLPIRKVEVEISGLIIKSAGSTAMINVNFGGTTKTITWGEADTLAQAYKETITIELPDGRLPAPFPVEAIATVKKAPNGSSVLVTLKEINVRMGELSTASTQ
jgi:hypothetical protein